MVEHSVSHVASSSSGTCLAASIAMMTGKSEQEVLDALRDAHPDAVQDDGHADVGLTAAAGDVGLREGYFPGEDPEAWAELLEYGPIALELKQGHVVVMVAIDLGGDDDASPTVTILDPWGGQQAMSFADFTKLGVSSVAVNA